MKETQKYRVSNGLSLLFLIVAVAMGLVISYLIHEATEAPKGDCGGREIIIETDETPPDPVVRLQLDGAETELQEVVLLAGKYRVRSDDSARSIPFVVKAGEKVTIPLPVAVDVGGSCESGQGGAMSCAADEICAAFSSGAPKCMKVCAGPKDCPASELCMPVVRGQDVGSEGFLDDVLHVCVPE